MQVLVTLPTIPIHDHERCICGGGAGMANSSIYPKVSWGRTSCRRLFGDDISQELRRRPYNSPECVHEIGVEISGDAIDKLRNTQLMIFLKRHIFTVLSRTTITTTLSIVLSLLPTNFSAQTFATFHCWLVLLFVAWV
jgi:hypothetical protein